MIEVRITNTLQPWRQKEFLLFAASACRIDGDCLGWLPLAAYQMRHDRGEILAVYNNEDLVGYLLWAQAGNIVKIYHTWVRKDARIIMHGKALAGQLEETAITLGCDRLELWCAVDLAANLFWEAIGFSKIAWRWGRAKKSRRHYLWRRQTADIVTFTSPACDKPAAKSEPTILLASRLSGELQLQK
jgi:GNAT superfamily N-acetyltransferase